MKKVLLLGSGELGKEFVIAAKRAGAYVVACEKPLRRGDGHLGWQRGVRTSGHSAQP